MNETCDLCGEVFGTPGDLVVHLKKAHAHDRRNATIEWNPEAHRPGLVCALCGSRFATATALADHNLRPHPMPRGAGWPGPNPT